MSTIRIRIRPGVVGPGAGVAGEDGTSWHEGEIHEASEQFGRWLISRGKATLAPDVPTPPVQADAGGGDPESVVEEPSEADEPEVPARKPARRRRR